MWAKLITLLPAPKDVTKSTSLCPCISVYIKLRLSINAASKEFEGYRHKLRSLNCHPKPLSLSFPCLGLARKTSLRAYFHLSLLFIVRIHLFLKYSPTTSVEIYVRQLSLRRETLHE